MAAAVAGGVAVDAAAGDMTDDDSVDSCWTVTGYDSIAGCGVAELQVL